MTIAEEVFAIFKKRGDISYFGECVSMTDHALQAAYFAGAEGAAPCLVVAALLHDIGHLIEEVPADIADWTSDACHETVGARWIAQRFSPEVSEPVRLHVPAKRYLCATDAHYLAKLSAASMVTLKLQGGPMSAREIAHFETEPFHKEAVRVRRWDDRGKIEGQSVPGLAAYQAMMDELAVAANFSHVQ
jgi:[1-hydroxy-2-(trimethylamino)ethyl]phosphonate dioxygenase